MRIRYWLGPWGARIARPEVFRHLPEITVVRRYLRSPFHLLERRRWRLKRKGIPSECLPLRADRLETRLCRILLEAGLLLTPATTVWDPRSWYPVFRYADAFAPTDSLRLIELAGTWEPRLKQVLGEEVAVGIAGYILREYFGVDHIVDVYRLLGTHVDFMTTHGSKERPDYFGLTTDNEGMIIEVKGVVGTASTLRPNLNKGKRQVQNVRLLNHPLRSLCGRLVIGTHVCIEAVNTRSETTTYIEDPEEDDPHVSERRPFADLPIRGAYAKALQLAGQPLLADLLLARQDWSSVLGGFERLELDFQTFDVLGPFLLGGWLAALSTVVDQLWRGGEVDLLDELPPIIRRFRDIRRHIEPTDGIFLPNGIAWLPVL